MWNAKRRLTCGYSNRLDTYGTLSESSRGTEPRAMILASGRSIFIATVVALNMLLSSAAYAVEKEQQMRYRMYALEQIKDWHEFSCLNALWNRESNWNPKAHNGSHYGIPQGKSVWLKYATPRKQIDWGIKYIRNRYNDACKANNHSIAKGYY
jgi:hypothetical protein